MLTAVAVSQAVEGPYFLNRKNRWDLGQHGNGKATFRFMIWFIIFHRSAVKCRWTQTLLPKCCREAQGVINLISSPSPSCYCVQTLQGLGIPGTFTPCFLLGSILFSVEPWAAAKVSSKQNQPNKQKQPCRSTKFFMGCTCVRKPMFQEALVVIKKIPNV